MIVNVSSLPVEYRAVVTQLYDQLVAKRMRNRLRVKYYNYRQEVKDLGIAVPPSMRSVETVIGWPAKGVEGLTKRTVLDGFTSQDDGLVDLISHVWDSNRLAAKSRMAHTDAAVMSCVFGFVSPGDIEAGEPEVVLQFKSAEFATGSWNDKKGELDAALSILDEDQGGGVTEFNLYLPGETIHFEWSGGKWRADGFKHGLGVSAEALPYKPSLSRPFGKSRITRAVMSLTDQGARTLLRAEASAEFFSTPQRYLLGADESAFVDASGDPVPAWTATIGRILALGRDEEGEMPQVGQFTQQTFEPHFAQIRQLATLVAAEFNMMPRSFGIMQDNPDSAEAISESKEDLVLDAEEFRDSVSIGWQRLMSKSLMILDGTDAMREAARGVSPHFKNPATPSVVSASDAIVKQISAVPWLAETREVLEVLGYDRPQIDSMLEQKRRKQSGGILDRILAGDRDPVNAVPVVPDAVEG